MKVEVKSQPSEFPRDALQPVTDKVETYNQQSINQEKVMKTQTYAVNDLTGEKVPTYDNEEMARVVANPGRAGRLFSSRSGDVVILPLNHRPGHAYVRGRGTDHRTILMDVSGFRSFLKEVGNDIFVELRHNRAMQILGWNFRADAYAFRMRLLLSNASGFRTPRNQAHVYGLLRLLESTYLQPPPPTKIEWRGVFFSPRQWLSLKYLFQDKDFQDAVINGRENGDWEDFLWFVERNDSLLHYHEILNHFTKGEIIIPDCGHAEVSNETVADSQGNYYCRSCQQELVETVEGDLLHQDDAYYWGDEWHSIPEDEAFDEEEGGLLESWGTSCSCLAHDRSFTSSPYGDFTLGFELELEAEYGRRGEILQDLEDNLNQSMRYVMFKEDGSLGERTGFEIVSAARRLKDHQKFLSEFYPYSTFYAKAKDHCGLHVHIDSRAFTALTLGKFLLFFNDPNNADFLKFVAGRHPLFDDSARGYAAMHTPINDEDGEPLPLNPATIKHRAGCSRYKMINLANLSEKEQDRLLAHAERDCKGNYSTVEVRLFASTSKKEKLLMRLEFVHAVVVFCREAGFAQLTAKGFTDWINQPRNFKIYPHLMKKLGIEKKNHKSRCAA